MNLDRDVAVEAAAKALFERVHGSSADIPAEWNPAISWENADPIIKHDMRESVLPIVEAAVVALEEWFPDA